MNWVVTTLMVVAFFRVAALLGARHVTSVEQMRAALANQGFVPEGMRYQHNCPFCVPLNQLGRYDLYVCEHKRRKPVALARFGDKPAEFVSDQDLRLPDYGTRIRLEV